MLTKRSSSRLSTGGNSTGKFRLAMAFILETFPPKNWIYFCVRQYVTVCVNLVH